MVFMSCLKLGSPRSPKTTMEVGGQEYECLFCCSGLAEQEVVQGSSLCHAPSCHEHTYCRGCLKRFFTDQVASSYHGSCKKMKCPTCTRVVAFNAWREHVDEATQEMFSSRASQLLSLQCSGCHTRKSLLLTTSPSDSTTASDTLEAALGSLSKSSAFDLVMRRFLSGEMQAQVALEEMNKLVPGLVEEVGVVASTPLAETIMGQVLKRIQDPERRAMLQLRYLHMKPKVTTPCCARPHCFKCKTMPHEGLTCEQYQATQMLDDVLPCPSCGVRLVKGDGCNTVTCLCGDTFNWSRALAAINTAALIAAFLVSYPETAPTSAATILREPSSFSQAQAEQARAWGMANQEALRGGRAKLYQSENPRFTARLAILTIETNSLDCPDRILASAWAALHQEEVEAIKQENARLRALTWEVMHGACHVYPITIHAAREPQYYGMKGGNKPTHNDLCFRAFCELKPEEVEVAAKRYEDKCVEAVEAMFGEERALRIAAELQMGKSSRLAPLSEVQRELLETYALIKSAAINDIISSSQDDGAATVSTTDESEPMTKSFKVEVMGVEGELPTTTMSQ